MRKQLHQLEIPGEHDARLRSWATVAAAYAARQPSPRRRSWKPVAVLTLSAALVAAVISPPGRAVLDELGEAVGIENAQPALFSLPTDGRLLVTASSGAWVVDDDGSKRLLGSFREAAWSPFGRYVVASRRNELVALTPAGETRWSLARRDVRFARWGGTRTDTRIAYLSRGGLRVVAGDGTGDHPIDRDAAARPPAWQDGDGHRLAYARRDGSVRVVDADTGAVLARDAPGALDARRRPPVDLGAIGAGDAAEPVLSPDRRWVVVGWPAADQFVFVRVAGGEQIRAVAGISAQFRSRTFPQVAGWAPRAEEPR
jgi:hypothetical protein